VPAIALEAGGDVVRVGDLGAPVDRDVVVVVDPAEVVEPLVAGVWMGPPALMMLVAAISAPVIARVVGLEEAGYLTSNQGTALRQLPSSIVVMGGGVVGVELAQVYARFGIKTVVIQGTDRILPRDHPTSSRILTDQLTEEGVDLRTGVTATGVKAGGRGRIVALSDGTTVEGAELLVAVGRRAADLRDLGCEDAGVTLDARGQAAPDKRMRIADQADRTVTLVDGRVVAA
jgi:pyruvate/2-oxoglutarate dehydrogenase complex dihydrolipoamide dehydrogenase (E3) component